MNTFGPDPRNNPAAADVVKEFRDAGFEPEAYTLYSYAAVQVMAQAITKANSTDTKTVADTIKSGGPWKTVIGDLAYDEKGDRKSLDYVMYVWKKGADGKITYTEMK
jgi:branched-chain amino acid transport system substrate-binding protein